MRDFFSKMSTVPPAKLAESGTESGSLSSSESQASKEVDAKSEYSDRPDSPETLNKETEDVAVPDQREGNASNESAMVSNQIPNGSNESPKGSKSEEIPTPAAPVFKGTPEMAQLSSFFYSLNNKFYYCGFVYKLNAVGANGRALFRGVTPEEQIQSEGYWSKWWMEQWGPVLHLWRVPDELSSFAYTTNLSVDRFIKNELDPPMELMTAIKSFQQTPIFINFADSSIELFDADFQSVGFTNTPPPPIPYTCHFGLSTAASNLYVFSVPSVIQANQWVASMRLALYETLKINLTFTNRLIRKPTMMNGWHEFQVEPFTAHRFRGDIKFEGPLQIRIPYSNLWKQFHVVATSKYGTEAYSTNTGISKKIFKKKASMVDLSKRGSLLFYPNKNAAAKGKPPIFVMYDVKYIHAIWPDQTDELKIETLCMAKLEGSFRMHSIKVNIDDDIDFSGASHRSFGQFGSGFPAVTGIESFAELFDGKDKRPLPTQLLIMAPTSGDLSRWITAVWCAFSIDSHLPELEDEIHEMTRLPEPKEGEVQPELVKVTWPTQMYLSLSEVGGITMNSTSLSDSFAKFSHYLQQKVNFSKQEKLRQWCEAVAKGEWERNICDRKELDYKIKQLNEWANRICEKLNEMGTETKKPHPTVLVSAMTSIIGWIGPVLSSMIDEVPKSPTKSSPAKSDVSSSISDSLSSRSGSSTRASTERKTATTSGSEGSVSEEERSDEGSQSDDESDEESVLSVLSIN
jgi:hypothetical protein